MIDFILLDKNNEEKNKEIENGYLINACMRDKISYNCIVTGEKCIRTIDSIIKLSNHSLQKIDLSDKTLFMNKKNSRKQRMINLYGVENNFQRKEIKEKAKETNIKKYGVSNYTKTDEYKIKAKKTRKERYGDENFNNREKTKETNIKKYGVEHQHKNKDVLQKVKIGVRKKGLKSSLEILKENDLELLKKNKYIGQRIENKNVFYEFRCLKCKTEFEGHLHSHVPICPVCYPKYRSKPEIEIEDFIKYLGFKTLNSRRDIIPPYEIDIFVPEKKLAIEFNGLYWHSEKNGGRDRFYHLNKTLFAEEKGMKLIHIFEDEWRDNNNFIKEVILYSLGFKTESDFFQEKVIDRRFFNKQDCINSGFSVMDCETPKKFYIDENFNNRVEEKTNDFIWDCGNIIIDK